MDRPKMLRLPASALLALHRVAAQGRSAEEASQMARQLGFETGEGFYLAFESWLAEQDPSLSVESLAAEEFWRRLGSFFSELGWGELEYERPHPAVLSLAGSRWMEAAPELETAQPMCHFTTGVLADLLTRVAGSDLAVMEVECRSAGAERCRFLLGSPQALEQVFVEMRQGTSYPDALEALH